MTYRIAKPKEADVIAQLHAESWRTAYKDILKQEYLDGEMLQDRLAVWRARFNNPKGNQHIIVAAEKGEIKGFVCIFGNDNAQWGALVDNLHVSPALKGRGIGKKLMEQAALWVCKNYPNSGLYLWVYKANSGAIAFYEKIGGENVECVLHENPGGGEANVLRYVWTNIDFLMNT